MCITLQSIDQPKHRVQVEKAPYSHKGLSIVAISSLYLTPNCKDLPLQLPDVPSTLLLRAVTLLLTATNKDRAPRSFGIASHLSALLSGAVPRAYSVVFKQGT